MTMKRKAKRKTKTRLGGSEDFHIEALRKSLISIEKNVADAQQFTKCKYVFDHTLDAIHAQGRAAAHLAALDRPARSDWEPEERRASRILDAAVVQLRKKCRV